jgi:hypothetical protein
VSEDFVGGSLAGAASEQSARQEQGGLGDDERFENRETLMDGSLAEQDIMWGTELHVLDPGTIGLSRNRQGRGSTEQAVARNYTRYNLGKAI